MLHIVKLVTKCYRANSEEERIMSTDRFHPMTADRSPDWLDKVLERAREDGEFDNLPGQGKPLNLPPPSSAPSENDLAFTMLSNAGYVPHFVALAKEIDSFEATLESMRANAAEEIEHLLVELDEEELRPSPDARRASFWNRLWRGEATKPERAARFTVSDIARRRSELKARHHERANELEAKVTEYHAAIPRELWHLQRVRRSPEAWDQRFDESVPVVETKASHSIPAKTP